MAKPITVGPESGGNLVTPAYAEDNGHANYLKKRNWRRVLVNEVRDVGYDYFWPNTADTFSANPGKQPFPLSDFGDSNPINLIWEAERQDGRTAVIVGTAQGLYRFVAMEDFKVVKDGYAKAGTFESNPGAWIKIGGSFNTSGQQRWEVANISGYTLFSNGIDLPVTYRAEHRSVTPVYDLRELGFANFGTIGDFYDMAILGDATELVEDGYREIMLPDGRWPSGVMTASQATTAVTATDYYFTAGDVGRTIVWENGDATKITAVPGPFLGATGRSLVATVGTALTKSSQTFEMRVKASQTGATFSATTLASIPAGSTLVTAVTAFFTGAMVGLVLRFANGWGSTISSLGPPPGDPNTKCTLADAAPEAITGLPFWVVNSATDKIVVAENGFFDASMVGQVLSFDDGSTRRIESYTSPTTVVVDSDFSVPLGFAVVDRPETYGRASESVSAGLMTRIQYRLVWSALYEPRKYGPTYIASIVAGSNKLVFKYPYKSLENNAEVQIAGAGPSGAVLSATMLYVAGNRIAYLDKLASVTVSEIAVIRTEMVGSTAGQDDPPGDYGAVLRIKELQGVLVIYKDTSIVLGTYTGDPAAPFGWRHRATQKDKTLHFRHCLVDLGDRHIYVGRSSFYMMDLGGQEPVLLPVAEMCKAIFFDQAKLSEQEEIFAQDNPLTKEAWFIVPSGEVDPILCYDYLNNVFRTSSIITTAACALKRPQSGEIIVGASTTWFLLAIGSTLCLYGRCEEPVEAWDGEREIFYHRSGAWGAAKSGYESALRSCMSSFGYNHGEKVLLAHVTHAGADCPAASILTVSIFSARNASDPTPVTCIEKIKIVPALNNNLPLDFLAQCFQDELIVPATLDGAQLISNPLTIRARTFEIDGVRSRSYTRISL